MKLHSIQERSQWPLSEPSSSPITISLQIRVQHTAYTTPNVQISENKPISFQQCVQVTRFSKVEKANHYLQILLGPKLTMSPNIAPNVTLQSEALFWDRSTTLHLTTPNLTLKQRPLLEEEQSQISGHLQSDGRHRQRKKHERNQ